MHMVLCYVLGRYKIQKWMEQSHTWTASKHLTSLSVKKTLKLDSWQMIWDMVSFKGSPTTPCIRLVMYLMYRSTKLVNTSLRLDYVISLTVLLGFPLYCSSQTRGVRLYMMKWGAKRNPAACGRASQIASLKSSHIVAGSCWSNANLIWSLGSVSSEMWRRVNNQDTACAGWTSH